MSLLEECFRDPGDCRRRHVRPAAAATGAAAARPQPVPRVLQAYKTVTTERLKKPEDGDWLMIRRTYNGWGHSPLKQITTNNVNRLQPVWSMSTGQLSGHEAPPIVNNGVMFVATPGNQVIAIDAKAGTVLWRYRKTMADDAIVLAPDQPRRGAARRQSVLCRRRRRAGCARRANRQRGVDHEGRGKQERLLHVGRAARGGRQGGGRRLRRRAGNPRFRRGL